MTLYTILIVDDEPHILSALRRSLSGDDAFHVLTAPSAEVALERLGQVPVDVVIADQDMPGLTGLAFLDLVRDVHPRVMRMMLSGKADLRDALEAVNNGTLYRFLAKPWEDEELQLMIRLALRHRDDQDRVRELSRLVRDQAGLFARIVELHPDVEDLVTRYVSGEDSARPLRAAAGSVR